jgi:hypothetical protein
MVTTLINALPTRQPSYIQSIHQCLEAILSPDTNQIKAATAELNTKYYKTAECIPALYEASASSPNSGVSVAKIQDIICPVV